MIKISLQLKNGIFYPFSQEDKEKSKDFLDNQILQAKIWGSKKPRSIIQNKWIHAIFRIVAANTEDPKWNTPEKAKRNVKMKMKFFEDEVVVVGNKVYFELRSFAFDKMEQNEATIKYEEAKLICAKFLGVKPEVLQANAEREVLIKGIEPGGKKDAAAHA